MKHVKEKADEINSILSTKYLQRQQIKDPDFIKKHLHKAIVVSRTSAMQQMIRKIIFKEAKNISKKTFSIVSQVKEGSTSLIKGIENAKKCHGNHSFKISHLERIFLQNHINLREFKQLKAVLVKDQLESIGALSKKHQGKRLNAEPLKAQSSTLDNHINPYSK